MDGTSGLTVWPRRAFWVRGRTTFGWGLVAVLLVGAAFFPDGATAQTPPDSSRPIVSEVDVRGNSHFSKSRLKQQIRTRPNRRVLGVPGFTWWRWMYRLGGADWMWDRVGRALRSGGEAPAYLDSTVVAGDLERLSLFYRQQGFRSAEVRFSVEDSRVCAATASSESGEKRKTAQRDWIGSMIFDE